MPNSNFVMAKKEPINIDQWKISNEEKEIIKEK